jgi:23S rRNA pseudouridine955/2504/2580 synthase
MSVHGGAGETGPTLIDLLRAAYVAPVDLHLVHRLDRATSGLIVLAKSGAIARAISDSWDSAEKRYLAVALGTIDRPMRLDIPIEDKHGHRKKALTELSVVARLDRVEPTSSLIALDLGTGRTHQIRVHLKEVGHPVLLDDKYGDFAANKAWARAIASKGASKPKHLMLHSWRLIIRHPAKGGTFRMIANPPSGWSAAVEIAGGVVDAFQEVP